MIKILSKVGVIFFLYLIISFGYIGLTTNPTEGDSIGYHIPIAKAYLTGDIFNPANIDGSEFFKYYPSSPHAILALLFLFHIPPNIFNILGITLLFFSLFYLGKKVGLDKNLALLFAASISTVNGFARWMDTQIIDIYLAAFFVLALALLQRPERKVSYFLKLGVVCGLILGSKYTGVLFLAVLCIVYAKKILKVITLKSFLVFLIPLFVLGLSWYVRNLIVIGNPMYPQGFLFFKDHGLKILSNQVWRIMLSSSFGFFGTINAVISEYMIWSLSVPIVIFYTIKYFKQIIRKNFDILLIILVGLMNLIIYLFLPSANQDFIMVSVIRYSYPAFIPFFIVLFKIAKERGLTEKIGVVAVANMFFVAFPLPYNPKLVFILVPVALFYFFKYKS